MKYKRILSGILSITCFASTFAIRGVDFQAKAVIQVGDIIYSTNVINNCFRRGTDMDYIFSALNLQDPHIYLSTGIAKDVRFFSGNIKKVTFEEGTCNWIYGKDKGEGFRNFMRSLFPSASGITLSSQGGVANENNFTRDLKNIITPEFIAKIASISYKYRYDVSYKEKSKKLLNLCERNSKIKFLEFERQYFTEIDNYLFRKEIIEKIKNLLEEKKEESFLKNILNKEELDRIMRVCSGTLIDVFKKDFTNRKNSVNKACYEEIQRTLEKENSESCVFDEDIELFGSVIDFLKESFINSCDSLKQNLMKDKKAMCTILSLVLNMFYAIENQEQDNSDEFLPEFTVEKMLMAYFIDNFQRADIEKFYKAAVENIVMLPKPSKQRNREKHKEIFTANALIDFIEGDRRRSFNPYKSDLRQNGPAQRLKPSTQKLPKNGKLEKSEFVQDNKFMFATDFFQDCVETAMKHTLNLLVYSKKGNWDVFNCGNDISFSGTPFESIDESAWIGKTFSYLPFKDCLKLFYKYQNGNVDQDSIKYRSLWNCVISNMNASENQVPYKLLYYGKDNNELDSDILNFLKFIYNVAYVLQDELELSLTQLKIAKDNLDNLIELLDKETNARYLTYEEVQKLENSIKEIYGLINCENLEVTLNGGEALLKNKRITGSFNVQIGDKFSFMSKISDSHACVESSMMKVRGENEIDKMIGDCNSELIRILHRKSFDKSSFGPRKLTFENFHSKAFPLISRNTECSFGQYLCKSDFLRNFHNSENLSEKEFKYCCGLMVEFFANTDSQYGSVDFSFIEKKIVKQKLIDLFNENETKRNIITSLLCECYFSEKINEDSIKEIIGTSKIDKYVIKHEMCRNFKSKKFRIPECVDNLIIEEAAFSYSNIEEFEVPETVKSVKILPAAFLGCKKLKSVIIPNMSCVGNENVSRLFQDCESLETVKIKGDLKFIGENYFRACKNLKSIELPDSLKSLGRGCFSYCSSLDSIKLPDSVEILDEGCFAFCKNLKSIALPRAALKSIERCCFEDCEALENISLPNSLESIGDSCFSGCKNLKCVKPMFKSGANIEYIGRDCFCDCNCLEYVCISNVENLKLSTEFSNSFLYGVGFEDSCVIYFFNKPSLFDEASPLRFHTHENLYCVFDKNFEEYDGLKLYKFEFLRWEKI